LTSVLTSFEAISQAQPEAISVSFAGRRVTYAQLNERANRIAGLLQVAGVAVESLVAVYQERSPDLIASLLGVWKAGGAYLPIDPTNPRERVASILEDSGASFVLTSRSLIESLTESGAKLVCIEDLAPLPAGRLSQFLGPPRAQPLPEQPAYVIYTSGSTGRPKGAEITHGALHNVIEAIGKDISLQPSDVVLASATIAFDIANEEIFLPLVAGACVHLLETEFVGDGRKLIEVMHRCKLSLVFGTPTSWQLALEAGWQGDRSMQIIVGGEVLPLSLALTLAGMTRAVWNHYGPTETAICATRERIAMDAEQVTLGRPIENASVYVLDKDLRPTPTGDVGEIFIGGVGVGRSYRNRPDLSDRVFVADPFSEVSGARMFKTGDLGRFLPDGRLDFQGRVDHQIKLRGFRIELEEIEAAVRSFTGVHAAIAQVVEYGRGDERLVAYFLGDAHVEVAGLRDTLRKQLPYYMLPSELIPIESLPMTINGKVDREALDAIRIKFEATVMAENTLPSSDDLEAKLRALWQKLLKVRRVGPDDDFFDLGGHSLLATRMFAEIEKMTGHKIPLSALIQNPTAADMATYLRGRPEGVWPCLVPIREHGSLPPLFIAHGLGSNLLLFRELAQDLGDNQPVYGIQLAAPADATLDELKLEAIAARVVEEICMVDPVGPYDLAGHSLGGLLVFEVASQLRRRGKEIGLLALLDCQLHDARRKSDGPWLDPVALKATWLRWRKKYSRLCENGIVNTMWRKILYSRLIFKIWLLRQTYREGAYRPQLFGFDPYIALFAERYQPQPIDADGVLFVAEDEMTRESAGLGWSRLLRGRLSVQKILGSHQTIFNSPNVSMLAGELAKRIARSSQSRTASTRRKAPRQPMV
jgi:amino acid adenylation domain-containing protein